MACEAGVHLYSGCGADRIEHCVDRKDGEVGEDGDGVQEDGVVCLPLCASPKERWPAGAWQLACCGWPKGLLVF